MGPSFDVKSIDKLGMRDIFCLGMDCPCLNVRSCTHTFNRWNMPKNETDRQDESSKQAPPLAFLFLELPAADRDGTYTGISAPTGGGYPPEDDPVPG